MSKDNIEKLSQRLKLLSDSYYNGEPLVSDSEFDALVEELSKLDPNNPFLTEVGAPVQTGVWPKRRHSTLMGSLSKVNTEEEWTAWLKEKGNDFFITEKADGSTIVASYKKGKLVALTTRGDGSEGEEITPNAAHIPSVKAVLPEDFTGDLRGEAFLRRSVFDQHFAPVGYKNPRNAANGKLREQKDVSLLRYIEVMWFDVLPENTSQFKTEADKHNYLKTLGLPRIPGAIVTKDQVWKVHQGYVNRRRATLDYEIDGLVVKIQNLESQSSLGIVGGRPKGAVAIKFPPQEKMSTLLNVEWQRGLKGRFTPVGILSPVDVGGVTITKCSLHGMDQIKRLGLHIGDKVMVIRANDVIPQIQKRVGSGEISKEIVAPKVCDACDQPLTVEGAYVLCPNQECPGDLYGRLMAWMQKLNIMGIGPSIVEGLIKQGITEISDLYTVELDTFVKASGSDKVGAKIYANLHAAKKVSLATFLGALSISHLGSTNGQRLEQKFKSLDAVLSAKVSDFETVPGIKTISTRIFQGLQDKRVLIDNLREHLLIEEPVIGGSLTGKSFCITGSLSKPRKEVEAWIKQHGGETRSSVAKGLTYLVTDDPNSGSDKNAKADKYGVQKISEEQLYQLVG